MGHEAYRPTPEDMARLKVRREALKVSGDGVFATCQGEGVTAGLPAVFLRLHFCNLTCGKPDGWKCDTQYTWDPAVREFWTEPVDWTPELAAQKIEAAWEEKFPDEGGRRVVVTGGEPLLQQAKVAAVLEHLPGWQAEIETNGTIRPIPELKNCQFNCSPKLTNSGNSRARRYQPEALKHINGLQNSWFKFVASGPGDLKEIDLIAADCQLTPGKILVMPEGQTAQAVEAHAKLLAPGVDERGWQITMRNQLVWYGPKRRT